MLLMLNVDFDGYVNVDAGGDVELALLVADLAAVDVDVVIDVDDNVVDVDVDIDVKCGF